MNEQPKVLKPVQPPAARWYDLEWLVPFRSLMLVVGGTLMTAGAVTALWRIAGPSAAVGIGMILAGAGLAFLAWRMAER